jgi:hypothetical protein
MEGATSTAVLYNLGKTIAHVLSLPLALHHSLAPGLAHLKDNDPESHKYDDVPAELALLVAVIIVLKMVYGFDGRPRCVREGQAAPVPMEALRRCRSGYPKIVLIRHAHFPGWRIS